MTVLIDHACEGCGMVIAIPPGATARHLPCPKAALRKPVPKYVKIPEPSK